MSKLTMIGILCGVLATRVPADEIPNPKHESGLRRVHKRCGHLNADQVQSIRETAKKMHADGATRNAMKKACKKQVGEWPTDFKACANAIVALQFVPKMIPKPPPPPPPPPKTFFNGFRNSEWGSSVESVKATESANFISEKSKGSTQRVNFTGEVGGSPVTISYDFTNNKLVSATYIFDEEHSSKLLFVEDFAKVTVLLKEKYDDPITEDTIWLNALYKDDVSDWGMAVSVGHLKFVWVWETNTTEIRHGLVGDNFNITHGIVYRSKKFMEMEKLRKLNAGTDGL